MPNTVKEFLTLKLERKCTDAEIHQLYFQFVLNKEQKLSYSDPLFYQNVEWNEPTKMLQAFVLHALNEKKLFAEGDLIALLKMCKPTVYLTKALTAILSKEQFVLVFYYLLAEHLKELTSFDDFLRNETLFFYMLRERIELDPKVSSFYQNTFRPSIRTIEKEPKRTAEFNLNILNDHVKNTIPHLPRFLVHYRNFLMGFFAEKQPSLEIEKKRNLANSYIFLRFFAKLLSERAQKSDTTLIQNILIKPVNDQLLALVKNTLPAEALEWQKAVNGFLIKEESFHWETLFKEEKFEDNAPFSEYPNSRKAITGIEIGKFQLVESRTKTLIAYAENKKFPQLLSLLQLMHDDLKNNFWGTGTVIDSHVVNEKNKNLFMTCLENEAPKEVFQAMSYLNPCLLSLEKMDNEDNSYWHLLFNSPDLHKKENILKVDQLIALGLKCNLRNKAGKTPLHILLENAPKILTEHDIYLVEKMVIEGGASLLDKDLQGQTVMSIKNGIYKSALELINNKKEYTARSTISPVVATQNPKKNEKRNSGFIGRRISSFFGGDDASPPNDGKTRSPSITEIQSNH